VDSGLFFDRNTRYFERDWIQTLEPRLYYLYIPYKDQSKVPLFDTSQADFSYAQIFSENYYNGSDRISNANQLTAALTSRLILPSTGQEIFRALIAQQYYFTNQRVPLVGTEPLSINTTSPVLASLAGRVTRDWTAEATVQYAFQNNTQDNGLQRANIGVRYSPEIAKVINLGYRFTAKGVSGTGTEIRQADVSGQWPVGGGWYLVGRYSYDFTGGQSTEALGGVEYNAGCWIFRGVVQSFIAATNQRTNVFFLQIELNGLSRIGSNPLEALRRNIPGYQVLNRPVVPGTRAYSLDPNENILPGLGSGSSMPYGGASSLPFFE
jgi:LPS-assembly protein